MMAVLLMHVLDAIPFAGNEHSFHNSCLPSVIIISFPIILTTSIACLLFPHFLSHSCPKMSSPLYTRLLIFLRGIKSWEALRADLNIAAGIESLQLEGSLTFFCPHFSPPSFRVSYFSVLFSYPPRRPPLPSHMTPPPCRATP